MSMSMSFIRFACALLLLTAARAANDDRTYSTRDPSPAKRYSTPKPLPPCRLYKSYPNMIPTQPLRSGYHTCEACAQRCIQDQSCQGMWHQQISVGLQKLNFTAATRLLVSNNVCMQLGSEQGMCKLWKASFPAAASPPAYNSGGHPGYSGPATGSKGYGGPAGSKTNGGRYHWHYHHSKAPKSTCALFSTVSNVDMSTTPVMSYVSCHSCMKSYLNDPKARSLYWASLPLPVTTSKAVIIANAGGNTEVAADWLCRQFTSAFQTSSSILCPDDDVGGYSSPYSKFKVVGHRRSRVLLQPDDDKYCEDRTDGMAVFLASEYNCTWYYSCVADILGYRGAQMPCPPGLVFEQFLDVESGMCYWPIPGDDCFQN